VRRRPPGMGSEGLRRRVGGLGFMPAKRAGRRAIAKNPTAKATTYSIWRSSSIAAKKTPTFREEVGAKTALLAREMRVLR
jgi:hypothetical protein